MSGTVLCIILCLFVAATSHPTTGQCTRPSGMMSWLFSTDSTLDFTSISHLTSNRDAVWRGTLRVYRWRIDSHSRQCRRCRAFPAPNREQESLRTTQITKRRKEKPWYRPRWCHVSCVAFGIPCGILGVLFYWEATSSLRALWFVRAVSESEFVGGDRTHGGEY